MRELSRITVVQLLFAFVALMVTGCSGDTYLVYISGNKTTAIAATGKTVAIAEKYSDSVISKVIIPADNSTGENPLTFDFVLKHNPSESDLFTTTEEP